MAKTLNIGSSSSPVDIAVTTGGIKDKNASLGTSGQVLTSDGSKVYWGELPSRTYIPITEDMVTVTTDETKGVSPYSTSYGYTNITVDLDKSLLEDGLMVSFIINTKMVVASANRNVRVRFGEDDVWHPVCGYNTSILTGSTYFVKAMTLDYMYKTTMYSYGAFHQAQYDTNTNYYEAMNTVAAATAAKTATGTYPFAALRDGLRIQCIWRYGNTAKSSVTFNWNSLGAKPLFLNGSAISSSNYNIPVGVWPMYYDGTNWYIRTDGKHPNPKFFDDVTKIKAADGSAGAQASSNSVFIGAGDSSIDITDSSIGVTTNSFKWGGKTILTEDYEPEITSMKNDYCEIGIGGDAYISAWEDDNSADVTVSVDNGVMVSTTDGLNFSWNGNQVATEADLDDKQDKLVSGTNICTFNGYSLLGSGTFRALQFGFTYCTCDTATATAAKVISVASPTQQPIAGEGAILVVKFTHATGSNFTVQYSGRTPYSVVYKGAAVPAGLINDGDEAVFMLCRSSDSSINYYFNLLAVTGSAVEGAGSLTEEVIRGICSDGYSITFASTITRSYSFTIGYTNGTEETKPVRDFAGQTIAGVDYMRLNIGGIAFDKSYTYLYQPSSASSSPDRSKATEYTYTGGTEWQNGYIFLLSDMTITSIAAD